MSGTADTPSPSRPATPSTASLVAPVVLLVRHGETEWNLVGRMQGHTDVALTERGRSQARALAERFRRERPARIVSSDLARARETAEIVAAACGVAIDLDPELREQHLGSWQGITFDEALERDPDVARRFAARDPDARPPGDGAETRGELSDRRWEALGRHAAPGSPGPLVIVAHGGVVQSIVSRVLGLSVTAPRRFHIPNASVTTLVPRGRGAESIWYVRTLSDVSHLDGAPGESFPFE